MTLQSNPTNSPKENEIGEAIFNFQENKLLL